MTQPVTYKYGADFQMKILAMIARDTGFVRQYHTILDPLHFQYAPMQILAQIILDNFKSFGVLISSTTAEAKVDEYIMHYRLDDGFRATLKSLLSSAYTIDISDRLAVADNVVAFSKVQAIKGTMVEVFKILEADGSLEEAERLMMRASSFGHDHDEDMGINVVPNMLDLPQLFKNDQTYATGSRISINSFPTLHKMLGGGPGRGQVFAVIGKPGVGKSTLMRTFARDAMNLGVPVAHYTIADLSATEVAMRYAALMAQVTVEELLNDTPNYRARASTWLHLRDILKVKEFRPQSVTVEGIRSHLTELKATLGWTPGVIVVDYPAKLKWSLPRETQWTNEAYNIDMLIDIAKEFNSVVWWAWHPTKAAGFEKMNSRERDEASILTMYDGSGAGAQANNVDGILSLNQNQREKGIGKARLWVDKMRRAQFQLERPIPCAMQLNLGQILEAAM